jgi:hypothetical protein
MRQWLEWLKSYFVRFRPTRQYSAHEAEMVRRNAKGRL